MSDDQRPADAGQKIDLDAARAARAEARRKAGKDAVPSVRFLAQDWPLPAELPAETVYAFGLLFKLDPEDLQGGNLSELGPALITFHDGVVALFGATWEKLKAAAIESGEPLSFADEAFLLEEAMDLYGVSLPEASASAPS